MHMLHEMLLEGSNQFKNKMSETCSKHEKQGKCAKVPTGNGPLRRPSCKLGDKINIDPKKFLRVLTYLTITE